MVVVVVFFVGQCFGVSMFRCCTFDAPLKLQNPRARQEHSARGELAALWTPHSHSKIPHPLQPLVDISLDTTNAHCLFRAIVIHVAFRNQCYAKGVTL